MEEEEENPLNLIFQKNSEGETTSEFEDIQYIPELFKYLANTEIDPQNKVYIIEQLQIKFNTNRYLMEYFSEYENNSIYIFIFELILSSDTTEEFQKALITFLTKIRSGIEAGKEIYEYIFQKLSRIYREEDDLNPDKVNIYLQILNAILGNTDNCEKPRNYFSCIGNGQFILDCNKQITMGHAFSIFASFKIGICHISDDDEGNKRISNLVSINFSNNTNINIDLKYPNHLIIKDLNKDFNKNLITNDFIILFITFIPIPQFNSIKIILYSTDINGQFTSDEFEIFRSNPIKSNDNIISIEFFKKFYGEVSSIVMFSQKEKGNSGILNSEFIEEISKFKAGLWKKKNVESFVKILKKYQSVENEVKKESVFSSLKKSMKTEEKKILIYDDLISIFSPMNCFNTKTIEDYLGKIN